MTADQPRDERIRVVRLSANAELTVWIRMEMDANLKWKSTESRFVEGGRLHS